jgi:hypothetical protein
MRWKQVAVGYVPRRNVTQKQAAVYLLLEFWAFDAKEGDVDEFHWINEDGYLSIAELAAIARCVLSEFQKETFYFKAHCQVAARRKELFESRWCPEELV